MELEEIRELKERAKTDPIAADELETARFEACAKEGHPRRQIKRRLNEPFPETVTCYCGAKTFHLQGSCSYVSVPQVNPNFHKRSPN